MLPGSQLWTIVEINCGLFPEPWPTLNGPLLDYIRSLCKKSWPCELLYSLEVLENASTFCYQNKPYKSRPSLASFIPPLLQYLAIEMIPLNACEISGTNLYAALSIKSNVRYVPSEMIKQGCSIPLAHGEGYFYHGMFHQTPAKFL